MRRASKRQRCGGCCDRGAPLHHVQRWLGHELLATTQRYLGRYRSDDELRAPVVYSLYKTTVPQGQSAPTPVTSPGSVDGDV